MRREAYNAIMARKMWRHAVTRAGQVSIPAEIRERWGTSNVLIEDQDTQIVLRPAPDNPWEGVRGILKEHVRHQISGAEAQRIWRAEDNAASERKWREHESG